MLFSVPFIHINLRKTYLPSCQIYITSDVREGIRDMMWDLIAAIRDVVCHVELSIALGQAVLCFRQIAPVAPCQLVLHKPQILNILYELNTN